MKIHVYLTNPDNQNDADSMEKIAGILGRSLRRKYPFADDIHIEMNSWNFGLSKVTVKAGTRGAEHSYSKQIERALRRLGV